MAKEERVYKWVKGSGQYQTLKAKLEKRGWVHHLDYTRRSDAFRAAREQKGIVIGRHREHPKGVDTYTVYRKRKR